MKNKKFTIFLIVLQDPNSSDDDIEEEEAPQEIVATMAVTQ